LDLTNAVDGFVESWRYVKSKDYGGCWKNMWRKIADIRKIFKQMIIYTLCFGIVLVIAVTNPQVRNFIDPLKIFKNRI
jgi:hypothetical protein